MIGLSRTFTPWVRSGAATMLLAHVLLDSDTRRILHENAVCFVFGTPVFLAMTRRYIPALLL